MFERRGALISLEHWCVEKDEKVEGVRVKLEDWIEFKDQDGKLILRMQFFLWRQLGFELQGRIIEELRKNYG